MNSLKNWCLRETKHQIIIIIIIILNVIAWNVLKKISRETSGEHQRVFLLRSFVIIIII